VRDLECSAQLYSSANCISVKLAVQCLAGTQLHGTKEGQTDAVERNDMMEIKSCCYGMQNPRASLFQCALLERRIAVQCGSTIARYATRAER